MYKKICKKKTNIDKVRKKYIYIYIHIQAWRQIWT